MRSATQSTAVRKCVPKTTCSLCKGLVFTAPRSLSSKSTTLETLCWTSSFSKRCFSSGPDPQRLRQLRKSTIGVAGMMGRDRESRRFENNITVMRMGDCASSSSSCTTSSSTSSSSSELISSTSANQNNGDGSGGFAFEMGSNMQASAMVRGTAVVKFIPSIEFLRSEEAEKIYPREVIRRISREGECKLMGARLETAADGSTNLVPSYDPLLNVDSIGRKGHDFITLSDRSYNKTVDHAVIYVVQPFIDGDEFRFEEAQVELIVSFRNMLVEVAETPGIDRILMPPLCLYCHAPHQKHVIAKLNQSALIKAFHKLAPEDREELLYRRGFGRAEAPDEEASARNATNIDARGQRSFKSQGTADGLTVEVFVDASHYDNFVATFAEEPFTAPEHYLIPSRMDLYPGLAPPETMRGLEGWIGSRPELIEAIETKGKSLIEKQHYALDGSPITRMDASALTSSGRMTRLARIAAERETAVASGFALRPLTPLGSGIEGDAYQPVVRPQALGEGDSDKKAETTDGPSAAS